MLSYIILLSIIIKSSLNHPLNTQIRQELTFIKSDAKLNNTNEGDVKSSGHSIF